ncbi:MAG TPA: ribosome small subunit-dependent GTPase A [Actinomycetes bacterium]|nr:ribosome small subunit-dependent GTPase A [Actinomycetes bacterium]
MSPSRRRRDLDEDDVRVRPSRRSRPRSKERPAHVDAVAGVVVAVDRGRLTCHVDGREVVAMKARELGRRSVVVGDRVDLVGDVSGTPDSLARIVRVQPRTSVLRRTADDTDPVERVIVANADQLVVVTALADPAPRLRLVDRCLVAAYDAGLRPLLCLTKADLAAPDEVLETYRALDVDHVVVRRDQPLDELVAHLRDRVSVLVGHSGVGKSTMVNTLVPGADRATGGVNLVTGRGRHVSSSAVALELAGGGWVIDTPGVRSFGLAHVDLDRVIHAFPDLEAGTVGCPRSCSHDEPECALDDWVAAGHGDRARLASLRRLLSSRDQEDDFA